VEIPPECGRTNITQTRIVNGTPAKKGSWPWQVAIGYTNPDTGGIDYLCGGALVTARHVVTAAHCMREDLVTVLLGEHVLHNDTDGARPEEFSVIRKTPHENYNSRTFDNDIAILTFDSPVTFKSGIQPVCLPSATAGAMEKKFENEGVYITGWGAVKFRGPTSNTLLQALIQVTEQSYCKEKFKQFSNVAIDDTKICARDRSAASKDEIKDACQGDSGGPMVIDIRNQEPDSDGLRRYRKHLIGIVSFGYRCSVPGFPGVYTRVTEYDGWIRHTIANDVL